MPAPFFAGPWADLTDGQLYGWAVSLHLAAAPEDGRAELLALLQQYSRDHPPAPLLGEPQGGDF